MLKRINQIVKAYVHEGLDRLEDPAVLIKQYLRDMQENIKKTDLAIEKQVKLEQSLMKDLKAAEELVIRREEQARIAIQADKEELARMTLLNKKELESQIERYKQLLEKNTNQMDERKKEREQMKIKYNQLRDQKLELMLRVQALKANEKMKKIRPESIVPVQGIDQQFERMEERIEDLEWQSGKRYKEAMSQENLYTEEVEQELMKLKEETSAI